jgi:hypothetical protein
MCNLSPEEKQFIAQCVNAAFNRGDVRGDVGSVAQAVSMATRIIHTLSGTGQGQPMVSNGNGAQREAVGAAESE